MVAMTLDLSTDYLVWDGRETVTFTAHQHASPTDTNYTLTDALRRALTFKEMAASGGVYTTQDRRWIIPQAMLTAAGFAGKPRPADWLTDAQGVRWTVLATDFQVLQSVWLLTTRNLVLAAGLYDLISLWRPANLVDPAGSRGGPFVQVYADVPARIQEQDGEARDERGQRITVRRYTVYLGQRLEVIQEDRMQDAAGNKYEVMSYSRPDLITDLMELHVERRGW